jgi:hypothetical protein
MGETSAFEGTVCDVDADSFGAILRARDGTEYYATIDLGHVSEADRPWLVVGAVFYLVSRGERTKLRFSHAVWTEEQIEELKRRAGEFDDLFSYEKASKA